MVFGGQCCGSRSLVWLRGIWNFGGQIANRTRAYYSIDNSPGLPIKFNIIHLAVLLNHSGSVKPQRREFSIIAIPTPPLTDPLAKPGRIKMGGEGGRRNRYAISCP